jgi:hypothetical protein
LIEIRKVLSTYLKTLHPRVYFQIAPSDAVFPYIVYDLPSIFSDGEGGETATLDIDGWDMNSTGDTTAIENLMKTINGKLDENGNPTGLDKRTLVAEDIVVTFFLENKLSLLDDDKRIKRRKYTYSGKLIRG